MSARPYLPCREIIEFLAGYLANELPEETRFEFDRHLAVCPSCVAYLGAYKETIRMARGVMRAPALETAEPPEELVKAIMESLRLA